MGKLAVEPLVVEVHDLVASFGMAGDSGGDHRKFPARRFSGASPGYPDAAGSIRGFLRLADYPSGDAEIFTKADFLYPCRRASLD